MKKVLTECTSNRIEREGCKGREKGKGYSERKEDVWERRREAIVIHNIRRSELKFHWYLTIPMMSQ